MGDCRIRILIAKDVMPPSASIKNGTDDEFHTLVYSDSADATLRDVYDATLKPIWNRDILPDNMCLWDCTLNPPTDITEWLTLFSDKTGRKSKTLYDGGWFPSGTWQVLRKGTPPSRTQNYDDVQYNLPSSATLISSSAVKLTQGESMTPSQVLQSVTERFPESNEEEEQKRAAEIRRQRKRETKVKEAKRHAQLEERIHQLGSSKMSNKAVSQQVRRMLIKSRCTGSSSLKMHDRVYLHIVIVQGDDDTREEFRYFSQQDTVARILSVVAPISLPRESELLVRRTVDGDEIIYRRLPLAMRLYEAIAEKYLEEIDAVVVRCFTPPDEEPTTSIIDTEGQESDCEIQVEDAVVEDIEGEKEIFAPRSTTSEEAIEMDSVDHDVTDQLAKAIAAMDEAASAKSKKKTSSTSEKVRNMLMKSKAKGDTKRVPQMEDRFYMDLVVVEDFNDHCTATASPVFLAKSDSVERILRDCVSVLNGFKTNILVPTREGSFRFIPKDITFQEAEANGFIKSFDRVVVRLFK